MARPIVPLVLVLAACGAPPGPPPVPGPAPAARPAAEPRWRFPASCPLHYAVRSEKKSEMQTPQGPFGGPTIVAEVELVLEGRGPLVDLRAASMRVAFMQPDGTRAPWQETPTKQEVVLDHRGSWLEQTGEPSALWGGGARGLNMALLWPELPPRWEVGAEAPVGGAGRIAGRVEEVRVEEVRVEEVKTGSPSVAVLQATSEEALNERNVLPSVGEHPDSGMTVTTTGTIKRTGRYEVTTDGRLLRAEVTEESFVEVRFGEDAPQRHHPTTTLSAILVEACDGPTFARPTATETPGSQALAAWANVVENVAAARPAAHLFHATVRQAHGAGPIDAALRAFVDRHGPSALGHPAIPPEVVARGDRVEFTIVGSARLATLPPDHTANVKSHVVVDLAANPPVVRSLRVEDNSGSAKDPNLLIIDDKILRPR
jgi:hypothetical protein